MSVDKLREINEKRLAALRCCGHSLYAGSMERSVPYGGPHLKMVDSVAIIGVGDLLELIIRDLVAERERHRTVCFLRHSHQLRRIGEVFRRSQKGDDRQHQRQ